MNLDLTGKNAIVCGSSQGIGKAIALELAVLGANVTLFSRDKVKLMSVLNELDKTRSQNHDILIADFFNPEEVITAITGRIREGRTYHILVNNTGGPPPGAIIDADAEDFIRGFTAHLINNQQIVQQLVPGMKKEGYGRIINIISTSVKVPIPGLGVSNTIRGAVASWAKTLSNELAPYGITVNNILPGFTDTSRLDSLFEKKAKESGITKEEFSEKAKKEIPAGRLANPAETAYAAAFLASPSAGYITGVSLPVDGGKISSL
ncbi:MAG: SDR family oxidoreductase [Cyclobacteriaceae bacterium]|nr:SDR family oxidoreductase [Cyclobacteriaceae bacterium]